MQIEIWTVGKKQSKNLDTSIADYQKRLQHYISMSWKYIPASKHKQQEKIVTDESVRILGSLDPKDKLVLLDERGKLWKNSEWVRLLQNELNHNPNKLIFLIGGAYGVSAEIRQKAHLVLSLSPLVFPHALVRLMLIEQLYRNFSIMNGSSYHHE